MNEIKIFKFKEKDIRTVIIDDEPYFVGKDVATVLGYAEPRSAVSKKVDDEDRGVAKIATPSGTQEMTVINESGVYSLIFGSRLPDAKKFKHWVTTDVLPTIRKHGAYMTEEVLEKALMNPDFLIQLATELKIEKEKREQLEIENGALKPKAEYFDCIVDRNLLTNFRETAKEFKIKEREFIEMLKKDKFIYKDKKGVLMPYAENNDGLFELKEYVSQHNNWKGVQTLITPKGRETFRLLYANKESE